ncbi:MFS general substrate transporter [Suillus discolor]|uniref:MFS general substrate transporter n=1 Tax=Suillus discolor TaxID=1912936 RepID=A0A9P7FJH2_9AGAM|nr:MFS general substrate transporter [Suillus discolor]KAG2118826.1 MFS general substrate transporter [Suillus discolor]
MSSETSAVKNLDEVEKSSQLENYDDKLGLGSLDTSDGDAALQLVGAQATVHFSEEYNRKLRRKLDLVIPPISAAVYFCQYLDKTSLNYASIMGFPIVNQNYNLVSMAFYLGYLFWEFPTVYISQKLRLAKYLGGNIVVWGILLMLHASTDNFGAFFALRFLLGMCESCVAPCLILIISMFYKKDEQALFGGFVAYGISFYAGNALPPYKIIYILLGGLAVVIGIIVLIWLPDSPVNASMLTKEERIAALERVRNDQGGTENKKFKKDQVIEALTDPRTWLVVLSTILTSIPNGALSNCNISPRSKQTLILSTPGGIIGSAMVIFCGWYADKKNERMVPIVFALIPTIVGAAILIGMNGSSNKGVLLFATYIIGTFGSALSTIYAYNASNTGGHTKKVTINAMTMATFSIGNIIGTEIFQPKDAPAYIPGKTAIMVLLIVQLFVSFLLRWINIRLNRKRKAHLADLKAQRGWTDDDVQKERERHAFADLTDRQNIFFVYTC